MLEVVREVVADVMVRSTSKLVVAKQNDAGSRFLNVRIKDNGKSMDVPSTSSVILNVERPDNSSGTFYGTVNDDGTVRVELNSWMLEQAGTIACDISIVKENSAKLTTMTFYVEVEAAVCCDEDFIEAEEYSVLVELLIKTQDACDLATEAASQAVPAVQMCSEATRAAVESSSNANSAAKNANQAAADARKYIDSLVVSGEVFAGIVNATVE